MWERVRAARTRPTGLSSHQPEHDGSAFGEPEQLDVLSRMVVTRLGRDVARSEADEGAPEAAQAVGAVDARLGLHGDEHPATAEGQRIELAHLDVDVLGCPAVEGHELTSGAELDEVIQVERDV